MSRYALLASFLLLPACRMFGFLFPAPTPMQALRYPASPAGRAPCLLILLPGGGDDADAFAKAGFVDDLRTRHIGADVEAAAATYGYYAKWTFPERFGGDIVEPAVAQGYRHLWMVGVSMGGFGAADFATHHSDLFDGVFLLAPYLGEGPVLDEIHRSGGLRAWTPGAAVGERDERALWFWLKNAAASADRPALYLGAGEADSMHDTHQLLAAALPASRLFHPPGGHDWPVWRRAWADFLDTSDLAARCAPEKKE